jgi:serine/threonine-protein kinase
VEQRKKPSEEPTQASGPRVFGGRYRALEELGRGGMGRVLRARDLKLEREVALKLLPPGAHPAQERLRFEQEARAAGALNHPNIVAVYDVGEENGEPFIVSELLDGETLRKALSRHAFTPAQALDLAAQLAEGLAAAHQRGIIHRDIKPENLFLTGDGRLKILDFGIAKLQQPISREGKTDVHTETGALMGTPGYMSPEQLRGEHATARSDLFAFGAVAHEMLSGGAPFDRDSGVDTAHAILHDAPRPLPAPTPAALGRAIERCLEKEPAARYADAGELLADLRKVSAPPARKKRRWMLLALAAFVVLAAVLALRLSSRAVAAPSVAVLPFTDLSPQKDQEYFSDGLSEELLDALAHVEGLRVAGRTSSFFFKGKNAALGEIGSALHVGAVLEGSVRKEGNRVRVTARLANAADGYEIWSQKYDRDLTSIFAVQDEIARAVVAALRLKLLPAPVPQSRRTVTPEAHNAYLLGRQFLHRNSRDGFRRAQQAYEKALQLEPGYAAAWAGLAIAKFHLADLAESAVTAAEGERYLEAVRQSLAAAEKAIALDGDLADGYLSRGYLRATPNWEWEGALADMERGLSLKPEDADALQLYARVGLRPLGRLPEAIATLRKAAALDPLNAQVWSTLGSVLIMSGQFDAAREALNRSLEISPEQALTPMYLAVGFLLEGKPSAALAASLRSTEPIFRLQGAALAEHDLGHPKESQRALEEVIARWPYAAAFQIAEIYAWRGEKDAAFHWLERGCAQRDGGLAVVKVDLLLRKLRGDPRYAALLAKLNLPAD